LIDGDDRFLIRPHRDNLNLDPEMRRDRERLSDILRKRNSVDFDRRHSSSPCWLFWL
jgi:hypothetical protein